jgi:hypothetical protein
MTTGRRVILIAAMILFIGGLLLCGPAHHALHASHGSTVGDLHISDGGVSCDACAVTSVESPDAFAVLGPLLCGIALAELPPPCVPTAQPPLFHSPRGPPARA